MSGTLEKRIDQCFEC